MDKKIIQDALAAVEKEFRENQKTDSCYGSRTGEMPLAAWPTQRCRIVFLDIDGVLNSDESNAEMGTKYQFAKRSIAALNKILARSQSYIVITSSWRQHWTLRENAGFLHKGGVTEGRVIGKTPVLEGERGMEIDQWLRKAPFQISSYVILDDHDDMGRHRERLLLIDGRTGLDDQHVERAIEILKRPWVTEPLI